MSRQFISDDCALELQAEEDRHNAHQCDVDAFDHLEAARREAQMERDAHENVLPVELECSRGVLIAIEHVLDLFENRGVA